MHCIIWLHYKVYIILCIICHLRCIISRSGYRNLLYIFDFEYKLLCFYFSILLVSSWCDVILCMHKFKVSAVWMRWLHWHSFKLIINRQKILINRTSLFLEYITPKETTFHTQYFTYSEGGTLFHTVKIIADITGDNSSIYPKDKEPSILLPVF